MRRVYRMRTSVFRKQPQFFVRDRRRSGSYQSCRPVCSIALIQAKLKEFFDTFSSLIAA
jgi:hypothetical protein